jgi:tellurite resistance protein
MDALHTKLGGGEEAAVAAIDLAVLVATADGSIDAAERAALAASLEAVMGATVTPQVVRHLVRESRNQIEVAGANARARAIGRQLAERGASDEGLRLGLAIAFASNGLSVVERERLAVVAKAAGMSEARLEVLVAAAATGANPSVTMGETSKAPAQPASDDAQS